MDEFYKGFAQRARDLAEKADPFTQRRLLELAKRYDAKGKPPSGSLKPLPSSRATAGSLFSSSGEV